MNIKYNKIYKNFIVHNIIGHPLMQIFKLLSFDNLASKIHDNTLPGNDQENVSNTELDDPEVFKAVCTNDKSFEKD